MPEDDAVIAALDQTWARIQALEPGVPNAVWYLTSGRSSSCTTGPWGSPGDLLLWINLKKDGRPESPEAGRRGSARATNPLA